MPGREWLVGHVRRCRLCAAVCSAALGWFSVRRVLEPDSVPATPLLLLLLAWAAAVSLVRWGRRELRRLDEFDEHILGG